MVTKLALWLDIVSECGGDVTPVKLALPISVTKSFESQPKRVHKEENNSGKMCFYFFL